MFFVNTNYKYWPCAIPIFACALGPPHVWNVNHMLHAKQSHTLLLGGLIYCPTFATQSVHEWYKKLGPAPS